MATCRGLTAYRTAYADTVFAYLCLAAACFAAAALWMDLTRPRGQVPRAAVTRATLTRVPAPPLLCPGVGRGRRHPALRPGQHLDLPLLHSQEVRHGPGSSWGRGGARGMAWWCVPAAAGRPAPVCQRSGDGQGCSLPLTARRQAGIESACVGGAAGVGADVWGGRGAAARNRFPRPPCKQPL